MNLMHLLAIKAGSMGMCSTVDEGWGPGGGPGSGRGKVYKGGRWLLGLIFSFFVFSISSLQVFLHYYCSHIFIAANFSSLASRLAVLAPRSLTSYSTYCSISCSYPSRPRVVVCPLRTSAGLAYSFAIMPATTAYRQPTFPSVPLTVPGKSPYYTPPARTPIYSRVSMSPPEASSSVNTSAVPSLTSSTYGGSAASDYDSSHGGSSGVDLIEMLNDRLSNAVDPIPLDRSLAKQAQT